MSFADGSRAWLQLLLFSWLKGWVLRISLLHQQTPHNCSNHCVSLKYFLKPLAQKIIKEDRIAHGYTVTVDSTRTCVVLWESNRPPSHRQGGKLPYWDTEMAWAEVRRTREGFLCSTYGVKSQQVNRGSHIEHCKSHVVLGDSWEVKWIPPHTDTKCDYEAIWSNYSKPPEHLSNMGRELWRDASGIPCLLLSHSVFSRHPLSGIDGD